MPNFAPLVKAGSKGVDAIVDALRTFKFPQDEAMALAQQRAALPIEKNGLGLHPANTAAEREAAMNAIDVYHGTKSTVDNIDLSKFGASDPGLVGKAFYTTPTKSQASDFAMSGHYGKGANPNVMPMSLLPSKTAISQDGVLLGKTLKEIHPNGLTKQSAQKINKELGKQGYENVQFNLGDEALQYATLNPENLRSKFAAFDPWRRTAATAAAMGVAAPDLLAQELRKK